MATIPSNHENKDSLSPPRTIDVFGEHLHCKVAYLISTKFQDFNRLKVHYSDLQLCDKVTGMLLLGRSEAHVKQMLQNDELLSKIADQAIQCLADQSTNDGTLHEEEDRAVIDGLSYEEIGDLLFDRVSALEDQLAPEITGMLLEVDPRTLMTLLQDQNYGLLEAAVSKAKKALKEMERSKNHPPRDIGHVTTSNHCHVTTTNHDHVTSRDHCHVTTNQNDHKNKTTLDCSHMTAANNIDHVTSVDPSHVTGDVNSSHISSESAEEDEIGVVIYSLAQRLHPDAASEITGMILEMDKRKLPLVVGDKSKLHTAIEKAYTVWREAAS